jgi:hypothetical protein
VLKLSKNIEGHRETMPAERPYFYESIGELEALFASAPEDHKLQKALRHELYHRDTTRAATLLGHVEAALSVTTEVNSEDQVITLPGERKADANINSNVEASLARESNLFNSPHVRAVTRDRPAHANDPVAILANWIATEALSPQTYRRPADLADGDQSRVAELDRAGLPWTRDERSRPKHQLFYQIVMGSIAVDRATEKLVEVFGENEERSKRQREKAAIAAVLVDKDGRLAGGNAVAISSFAWALPIALEADFARMGEWTDVEHRLVGSLTRKLQRHDDQGRPLPLTREVIHEAYHWLIATLRLPKELVEAPTFAKRVYHHVKSRSTPEVDLLNSFFLTDLGRATKLIQAGHAGKALSGFLGREPVDRSPDLLTDRRALESLLAPAGIAASRWPAPGGHPLVTLQQAAVNGIRRFFADGNDGVVGVNGPPGTGKTTLLRDIVAGCVLDRAVAMSSFDNPLAAFTASGLTVPTGDKAFFHLYRVPDSIRGYEMLLVSSNNKAVENVSKELPSRKSVGRDLSYLPTIADRLQARRSKTGQLIEGYPAWGLIAAVLGNAENRWEFQQALWWDDDRSLRLYLKAARGDSVTREIRDDNGDIVLRETPTVVAVEKPPTPSVALRRWQKIRADFTALHASVLRELGELEKLRKLCLELADAREKESAARAVWESALSTERECLAAARAHSDIARAAAATLSVATEALKEQFAKRPGLLKRSLRTRSYRDWLLVFSPFKESKAAADNSFREATNSSQSADAEVRSANAARTACEAQLENAGTVASSIKAQIDEDVRRLGVKPVDMDFFEQSHEAWNLASPWVPEALHRKREDLFAAAMNVHQAFITAAAHRVSHNLGALMGAMQAGAFKDEHRKALLPDLWATLFMAVPVLSTTFASVERMLGDVPPESLGYLLIDEAGQATPQSAVGALMRVKKAIVVGDPLQVPPVVSLPERLISGMSEHFKVASEQWVAPHASVQTVADNASPFQARFKGDIGYREVGLPLLVHRRCQQPMFSISNQIAYDNQMVYAAGAAAEGEIAKTLGDSGWLDVDGTATSKWCAAEGAVVVSLMEKLAAAGIRRPDLYVITPFKIVATELRRMLSARHDLFEQFDVDADDWIEDRVGTVHTFQGKEAEAVIAVLGAPMTAQQSARLWAAETPNILNVMMSRAKNRIYVVGSRVAWERVGHAQNMSAMLSARQMSNGSLP